jgi:uncharacterized membrane protein
MASGSRLSSPFHLILVAGALALVLAGLGALPASAAEAGDTAEARGGGPGRRAWADRPERGIAVYTEFSRVVVPVGETLRMDLTVENQGRRDENVLLSLASVPRGWTASIKGGQVTVTGVPVTTDKPRVLTFTAEPDKGVGPGTYTFQIDGVTADRALKVTQTVVVTTEPRRASAGGELQVTTSYPVLRGPTDSSFEFSLEVNNKSSVDRVVDLAAEAPRGWEVTIKPGYESKQITSLRLRPSSSQTVALEVKPPRDARAGEYPVIFRASTDRSHAEARLQVVLTGIHRLDATTPTGRLSLDAVAGRPATTTLLVKNTGSAVSRNIKLSSFAPENWKVEFNPETIDGLEPGAIRQVEARITPAAQALVGDYSVGLSVDGEKANKTVELRVTVHAPATWAWVGVGIIAAVIGGLGGLFAWLGRR